MGSPAPEIIRSIPAFTAAFTYSAYCFVATMIFTPRIPPLAISLAFWISSPITRRLVLMGFFSNSGSRYPICAVEITPTPPQAATLPASPERLIPTPIPPWITGILAVSSPIFNAFIFSPTFDEIFRTVLPQSVLLSSDSFSAKNHPDLPGSLLQSPEDSPHSPVPAPGSLFR